MDAIAIPDNDRWWREEVGGVVTDLEPGWSSNRHCWVVNREK